MKLNRRSVLGAIGMVGVGTGAAFGSGAFTTVEAQREVEVNVLGGANGIEEIGDLSSSEEEIADNIAGVAEGEDGANKSSADVLVDASSNSIKVEGPDGTSYEGNELFPSSGTYDGIGSDDYVSLVANNVKIIFGPEGNELPVDSTLTQSGLFELVTRNGQFDVTFSSDTVGILTEVNDGSVDGGDSASAGVSASTSPAGVSGTVKTTDADQGPEALTIEVTDSTA